MAWPLVIVGMFFALGLILVGATSPMLIAVGMYLPFNSTSAIFVGGAIKWLLDLSLRRNQADAEQRTRAENTGILVSSGFIAGESLMAVILAFLVLGGDFYPALLAARDGIISVLPAPRFWVGLVIYPAMIYLLVMLPAKIMRQGGVPGTKIE